jgi:hypothetical protein
VSTLDPRIKRASEAAGADAPRCPLCGGPLVGGRLPEVRIMLPRKQPLPGETQSEPMPKQCPACANPIIYDPKDGGDR